MTVNPSWMDIAIRLVLAIVGGALIGYNRGNRNQAAGLRTTLLVCVAGCVTMVLANLLIDTSGKPDKSFVQLDMMRLPLGLLSGMGFIGAGAIIKRGDLVLGVTTAATLWFVTVVGICFGAGELALGAVAVAIGLAVLWGLKWADTHMHRRFQGALTVRAEREGLPEQELRRTIEQSRYQVVYWAIAYENGGREYELQAQVEWQGDRTDLSEPPRFLDGLTTSDAIAKVDWQPQGLSD